MTDHLNFVTQPVPVEATSGCYDHFIAAVFDEFMGKHGRKRLRSIRWQKPKKCDRIAKAGAGCEINGTVTNASVARRPLPWISIWPTVFLSSFTK